MASVAKLEDYRMNVVYVRPYHGMSRLVGLLLPTDEPTIKDFGQKFHTRLANIDT